MDLEAPHAINSHYITHLDLHNAVQEGKPEFLIEEPFHSCSLRQIYHEYLPSR
jgi:hypothetical protein